MKKSWPPLRIDASNAMKAESQFSTKATQRTPMARTVLPTQSPRSLTPKARHTFTNKTPVETHVENEVMHDPCNKITKEMIAAVSDKIVQLKVEKRTHLFKQKEIDYELRKQVEIQKAIQAEEYLLRKELEELGKEELVIEKDLVCAKNELSENKHQLQNVKWEADEEIKKLHAIIESLKKEKAKEEERLEKQKEHIKVERKEVQKAKIKANLENREKQRTLKELNGKKYFESAKEGKRAKLFKDMVKELNSVF